VRTLPGVLPLCLLAAALNFFTNPAFTLMPILVTREFGGDALRLATLNSVFGVGMLGGGLVLAAWGGFRRRIFTIILGVVGMGVSELVVGLAPAFELALGGMFLAAVMNAACNAAANALIQGSIAPQMLGRVITLVGAVTSLAAPLGMAIAGPVADALGVRTLYLAAGATQILVGMAAFMVPSLMHLGEGASAAPHPAEAVAGADPPGPS
jgi:DHA3 family macrolide efflux protein-like MFS transporter